MMLHRGSAATQRHACGRRRCTIAAVAGYNPAASGLNLPKRSKVEVIKEQSNFLRFPLKTELEDGGDHVSEDSVQLIKFHGSYQQDDREKRTRDGGRAYSYFLRCRQPAGAVTNQLYLGGCLLRIGYLAPLDGRGWGRTVC